MQSEVLFGENPRSDAVRYKPAQSPLNPYPCHMPFELVTDLQNSPSSSDVVARYLRAAITAGEYPEDQVINQEDVARLFNVSKIPVREALKRLEAEGFVAFQRNRGALVTSLSKEQITHIFQTRAILESSAARLAAPLLTDRALEAAEKLRLDFAMEKDVSKWAALNWAFHCAIYEGAGNPFLIDMIRSVNDRVERYLRIQLTLADGMQTADTEHQQILKACRSRDGDRAAQLVHDHVMHACSSLLKNLPQTQ